MTAGPAACEQETGLAVWGGGGESGIALYGNERLSAWHAEDNASETFRQKVIFFFSKLKSIRSYSLLDNNVFKQSFT